MRCTHQTLRAHQPYYPRLLRFFYFFTRVITLLQQPVAIQPPIDTCSDYCSALQHCGGGIPVSYIGSYLCMTELGWWQCWSNGTQIGPGGRFGCVPSKFQLRPVHGQTDKFDCTKITHFGRPAVDGALDGHVVFPKRQRNNSKAIINPSRHDDLPCCCRPRSVRSISSWLPGFAVGGCPARLVGRTPIGVIRCRSSLRSARTVLRTAY